MDSIAPELEQISEEIRDRVGSWCHRFDMIVDRLLQHGDVIKPRDLIRYAEEATDLVQAVIDRKKAELTT